MALVAAGHLLTISFLDSGENKTTRTYQMVSNDPAQAATDAAAAIALMAALTDATISGYTVSRRFVEDTLVLPAAGVQIENTAEVVVNIEGSAVKKAAFNIPAPVAGLFVGVSGPNSNIVDTADADLVAWVGQYASLVGNTLYISDGEHADGISRGFRVHKKSRKG